MAEKKEKKEQKEKKEPAVEEVVEEAAVEEPVVEEAIAVVEEPAPTPDQEPAPKAEPPKKNKKLYGDVMTTGSFLAAFLLLLIPGLNIILVIFWALGAARNRNKVHFSRAAIIFFLIEVLLTVALIGGGYIYANTQQSKILGYADQKTNGLLTYFEVDSFNDLSKLLNIPEYLVSKEVVDPEPEPEPVATRIIVNPEEISSYSDFMKLYNEKYAPKEVTTESTETTEPASEVVGLLDILEKYNVDSKEASLCYIVIDNDKESCIIAFEPTTGKLQTVPSIQINDQVVYVGGAK